MFDRSKMDWIRVKSLRDRALFIGRNSFSVSAVGKEGRNIENKIYYLGKFGCQVYSLEDGNLLGCEKGSEFDSWDTYIDQLGGRCVRIEPHDHIVKQPRLLS